MRMCRDGAADVNFFSLCGRRGGRLSVFCLLHLKGNVNIQKSNLWQNVKSAFGGSGWGMAEKCSKGGASVRTSKAKPCEELCGGSGVLLGVSPVCSTSVVLRVTIRLCFMLLLSGGGRRRRPVYRHRVMDRSCLVIGGQVFPFPPKGSAIGICKKKKKVRKTVLASLQCEPNLKVPNKCCLSTLQMSRLNGTADSRPGSRDGAAVQHVFHAIQQKTEEF